MLRSTVFGLCTAAAAMMLVSATAQAGRCDRGFSAVARVPSGANFTPPRAYDATRLARSRAIRYWKMKVRTLCPDHSAFWWRAHDKDVACEGYAGGIACRVAARPAHKFLH